MINEQNNLSHVKIGNLIQNLLLTPPPNDIIIELAELTKEEHNRLIITSTYKDTLLQIDKQLSNPQWDVIPFLRFFGNLFVDNDEIRMLMLDSFVTKICIEKLQEEESLDNKLIMLGFLFNFSLDFDLGINKLATQLNLNKVMEIEAKINMINIRILKLLNNLMTNETFKLFNLEQDFITNLTELICVCLENHQHSFQPDLLQLSLDTMENIATLILHTKSSQKNRAFTIDLNIYLKIFNSIKNNIQYIDQETVDKFALVFGLLFEAGPNIILDSQTPHKIVPLLYDFIIANNNKLSYLGFFCMGNIAQNSTFLLISYKLQIPNFAGYPPPYCLSYHKQPGS